MVTRMLPRFLAAASGLALPGVRGLLLAGAWIVAPAATASASAAPAPKDAAAAEAMPAAPSKAAAAKPPIQGPESGPAAGTASKAADTAPASAQPAPAKGAAPASLPDFTLPDLAGKTHASKDWKGQVVLVDFWATWCAGCRETIPALSRLQDKYGARGLKVVGVSLDKGPKAKVGKFTRKLKVNYQVLLDSEDTLSKVFGFEGLPSLYLFDKDGRLVKALAPYTALQDKELEALVAARFK